MDKLLIVIAVLGILALVFFAIKEGLDSTTKESKKEQIEKLQREVAETNRQKATERGNISEIGNAMKFDKDDAFSALSNRYFVDLTRFVSQNCPRPDWKEEFTAFCIWETRTCLYLYSDMTLNDNSNSNLEAASRIINAISLPWLKNAFKNEDENYALKNRIYVYDKLFKNHYSKTPSYDKCLMLTFICLSWFLKNSKTLNVYFEPWDSEFNPLGGAMTADEARLASDFYAKYAEEFQERKFDLAEKLVKKIEAVPDSSNVADTIDNSADAMLDIFKSVYGELTNDKVLSLCENCKPYTAAFLFVVSDQVSMRKVDDAIRLKRVQLLFEYFGNGILSEDEFEAFSDATDVFAEILFGNVQARGDWQAAMSSGSASDWLEKLFLCYGDLLKNPDYIHNYESAPVFIDDMDNTFRFAMALSAKEPLVIEYATKISNL